MWENQQFGFLTRFDTNGPVQSQKRARSLKVRGTVLSVQRKQRRCSAVQLLFSLMQIVGLLMFRDICVRLRASTKIDRQISKFQRYCEIYGSELPAKCFRANYGCTTINIYSLCKRRLFWGVKRRSILSHNETFLAADYCYW